MGGVARQQHAPHAEAVGHPAMDPERAAIDDLADTGTGHVARERGLRGLRAGEPRGVVAEIEPPATAGEGPGPHRVGPQEHEDLVGRARPPVDRRVDDRPDAGIVLSVEDQAEALAHGAVHAVAADQPTRADRCPLAACVPEGGRHAGAVIEEIQYLFVADAARPRRLDFGPEGLVVVKEDGEVRAPAHGHRRRGHALAADHRAGGALRRIGLCLEVVEHLVDERGFRWADEALRAVWTTELFARPRIEHQLVVDAHPELLTRTHVDRRRQRSHRRHERDCRVPHPRLPPGSLHVIAGGSRHSACHAAGKPVAWALGVSSAISPSCRW